MDIVSGILIPVNCTRSVVGDKKCGVACVVLDLQGVCSQFSNFLFHTLPFLVPVMFGSRRVIQITTINFTLERNLIRCTLSYTSVFEDSFYNYSALLPVYYLFGIHVL
jgi:hypothetical protein